MPAEQARSLHNLGMVYLVIGDRDRAQVFLERALELRRPLASQDPRGLQTSLIRVGDLRRERDDIRGALSLHAQALEAALSPWQKARALYAIGRDHEQNGARSAAAQAYSSALELDVPQDFPVRVALMGAYGAAQMRDGDDAGRALVERAAQLHEAQGDVDRAAENYVVLAEADRRRQQLGSSPAQCAEGTRALRIATAARREPRSARDVSRQQGRSCGAPGRALHDAVGSRHERPGEGAAGERGTARCRVQPAARARGLPQSRRRRRRACCERRACARRAAVGKAAPPRYSAGATKPASRNNQDVAQPGQSATHADRPCSDAAARRTPPIRRVAGYPRRSPKSKERYNRARRCSSISWDPARVVCGR